MPFWSTCAAILVGAGIAAFLLSGCRVSDGEPVLEWNRTGMWCVEPVLGCVVKMRGVRGVECLVEVPHTLVESGGTVYFQMASMDGAIPAGTVLLRWQGWPSFEGRLRHVMTEKGWRKL